ncbi:MAG TPA: ribosomal protein S18-alanine N-acetyltransferase, partial [Blastocatellia bacterium]
MSLSDSRIQEHTAMMKPYSVEQMAERDLIEVVELEEITGLNRWGYDAYRRELFKNPNSVMLVARNLYPGPRVIGFFAGWIVEDELHVNNIASHPDHRKVGIGQSLMESAIDEGRMRGVSFVLLEVRASNETAQALYRKLGFNFIGRRRDYYRAPTEDA